MAKIYTITKGTCVFSLAADAGLAPEDVWLAAENSSLREQRADMNMLLEGDEVFVPDPQNKQVNCATDTKYSFVRKGVPAKFTLCLKDEEGPISDMKFRVNFGSIDTERSGTSDAEGMIEAVMPSGATTAQLYLGDSSEPFEISVGSLAPYDTLLGAQQRLNNLGFITEEPSGEIDEETRECFISIEEMLEVSEPTGEFNQQIADEIESLHRKSQQA